MTGERGRGEGGGGESWGWLLIYWKLWESSWFEILRVSIFRMYLVIRLKGEQNPFFLSKNWAQKPQNSPKLISREPLVVEDWLTYQNHCMIWFTISGLRYVYTSDKWKCPKICILVALQWQSCIILLILQATGCIKLVYSSKWLQEWFYYGRTKICIPLRQTEVAKKGHFCFFLALYD